MKRLNLTPIALSFVLGVTVTTAAEAQSSTENSKGDAVLLFPTGPLAGGLVTFNSQSTSVRLTFLDRSTAQAWYYGLEASGKANNGIASVFQGEDVAPGAKIAANIGRHSIGISRSEGGDFNWVNVRIAYQVDRFTLFDKGTLFGNQFSRRTVSSPELLVSYGHLWAGSVILVGSVGIARRNNYDDLEPVKINHVEVISGPSGISRTITNEINARAGAFLESKVGVARVDGLIIPGFVDNRLGIGFYSDSGFADDLDRGTKVGGSLQILRAGQPTQSLGAVVVELDDAFGARSNVDFRRQLRVFIQAGVPFGFTGRPAN